MEQRRGLRLPKFYYGWVILGVAIMAGSFSTGAGVWGASVMARPMTEALGWSRASYFGALTIRSFVAGFLAPFVGPLQDTRNGPRRLMLLSGVLLGGSLMATRWVDSLWQFYLLSRPSRRHCPDYRRQRPAAHHPAQVVRAQTRTRIGAGVRGPGPGAHDLPRLHSGPH